MKLPDTTAAPHPLPSAERMQMLFFDAAREGRGDVIEALLVYGAVIDAHDGKGHTALILAAYHDRLAALNLLLMHGADPDAGDIARGNTALMGAAFKGHDAVAARLVAAGCTVNARNKAGQTALMMAAMFGRDDQVDMLLAAGADRDAVDAAGNTAASLAAGQRNAAMVARLSAPQRHAA
ncbi:ankyrin repeat domain-containing protein [Sphingomonas profundi]|uniref:ankyrin repeat domain-containing protein n=1 Tax=Alterirhizorhabdus profundi TaxID=2681549 RepID=UPI0012E963EF|nr:ankyrin repeat domain-containing protein [Sphingomonas profundi]